MDIITHNAPYLIYSIIPYVIGSIPFGLLLSKIFGYGDIRNVGSGNIGATNVLRTGNKFLALITLLLDASKGIIAILICYLLVETTNTQTMQTELFLLAGLGAIIGHCYPVWLKFKGGKGVATTLGVLIAAAPFTGFLTCLAWLLSFLAGRMSSLAAMSAMLVAPALTYTFYGFYPAIINIAISALVIWRHHENIARIRAGTEPRFREKKE